MSIERRNFLKAGVAISLLSVAPRSARADAIFAPRPGDWRRFQLRTRIELKQPDGAAQARVPVPSLEETDCSSGRARQSDIECIQVTRPSGNDVLVRPKRCQLQNGPGSESRQLECE